MSESILEYLPHFHEQFRKKRTANKIKIKTITQKTKKWEEIKKLDKKELRETRFNDQILKDTEILHYILEDAIVIIKANNKEQMAIYIQDKNLAKLHQNIFENEWKKLN